MIVIDAKISKKFLELAAKELKGDWVVIGGTVLILLGIEERVTVDIDLAGPESATQAETLKLMTIAEKIGLAPEAINQAGAFFLRKIPDWKKNLVPLYESRHFTLFRPNSFLFLKLKINRLSSSDLTDCLSIIKKEPLSASQLKGLKGDLTRLSRDRSKNSDFRIRCLSLLKSISITQSPKN